MLHDRRILVVVPARGGSKGIKLKNIRTINGIPIIALTGKLIQELSFVDRAIVSTDHPEIARIAKDTGLDVPFYRPEHLSADLIADWEVLYHATSAIEEIDKKTYDVIIMLQPTCPFRKAEHVKKTVEKLIMGNYDAVWTVSETDTKFHPLKQLVFENDKLGYYDQSGAQIIGRQQLTPLYHVNGVAYAITRDCIMNKKSKKGKETSAVIIDEPMVNIDTEFDFKLAEFIIEQNF